MPLGMRGVSRACTSPSDCTGAVAAFKRRYPKVRLFIHQGNPTQICKMVVAGEADLAIATAGATSIQILQGDGVGVVSQIIEHLQVGDEQGCTVRLG